MKHAFKLVSIGVLLAMLAVAQSLPVPSNSTVIASGLPSVTVGAGPTWARGSAYPLSADVDVAIRVGGGNWYSWSTVSTPVATVPANAPPLVSTITTGGAWIAAQSPSGSISLITIVQVGFSTIQATSTTAPAFTGSIGVVFRLGKTHAYIMPYAKASNASTGSASGALATAVFQPGVMLLYGFGGK